MNEIKHLYDVLLEEFGEQNWWPGETKFEIIVGAVLTQNVSWSNVETAIQNLKDYDILSPIMILKTDDKKLFKLIRPTGFYRQKTARLKRISKLIKNENGVENLFEENNLREILLNIKGVGPETADSIILYAAERPSFVVDAYTFRVLDRSYNIHGSYDEIKELFESTFNKDLSKLQDIHALIVELGKNYCSKNDPLCDTCPLSCHCKYAI
ncbi:MAG: endonuclease III domain-containing protein [Thermoplasmata archaeon]